MFEQRATTNAGTAVWPGRGRAGAGAGQGQRAWCSETSSNRSSKHYPVPPIWFDSCTADAAELCPTVAPHSAAIDTLAWSSATPGSGCYNSSHGPNRHIQLACFTSMLHLSNYAQSDSPIHIATHTCTTHGPVCVRVSLYSYLLVYVISSKRNNRTT